MKKDLRSLTFEELQKVIEEIGEKKYRGEQIYSWIHKKYVSSLEDMTNISLKTRQKLSEDYELEEMTVEQLQVSQIDGTRKYLFKLPDGNLIESVLMHYNHGDSICISSQAGCNMGCRFCASTIGGKVRDLTTGEMLNQIYRIMSDTGRRISNLVVMGTGEPLDNYDNLVRFIRMLSDERGVGLSQRNITVSTCGIIPNMRKLSDEKFQITLALSLHASCQEEREQLLPVSRKYKMDEVIQACDEYFLKTGRRITYEYAMVDGVNCSPEDADRLAKLFAHRNCHINLIPLNPISESSFKGPRRRDALDFCRRLNDRGINATIRRSMGQDIDGACGQLRRRWKEGDGSC